MDIKRAFSTAAWIVVGSIVGLVIFAFLLPVVGFALVLPVLLLPPIVAGFPADRYRRRNAYLPTTERALISVVSIATLALVIVALAIVAEKELKGSWPVYSVVAALEVIGVFFVLSVMTFKNE
jgi:MFS family permease